MTEHASPWGYSIDDMVEAARADYGTEQAAATSDVDAPAALAVDADALVGSPIPPESETQQEAPLRDAPEAPAEVVEVEFLKGIDLTKASVGDVEKYVAKHPDALPTILKAEQARSTPRKGVLALGE